jgi:hypothetical protein
VKSVAQICKDWPGLARTFRLRAFAAHDFARAANLVTRRRRPTPVDLQATRRKNATGVISNLPYGGEQR